jgi:hypothetical protein
MLGESYSTIVCCRAAGLCAIFAFSPRRPVRARQKPRHASKIQVFLPSEYEQRAIEIAEPGEFQLRSPPKPHFFEYGGAAAANQIHFPGARAVTGQTRRVQNRSAFANEHPAWSTLAGFISLEYDGETRWISFRTPLTHWKR